MKQTILLLLVLSFFSCNEEKRKSKVVAVFNGNETYTHEYTEDSKLERQLVFSELSLKDAEYQLQGSIGKMNEMYFRWVIFLDSIEKPTLVGNEEFLYQSNGVSYCEITPDGYITSFELVKDGNYINGSLSYVFGCFGQDEDEFDQTVKVTYSDILIE